MPAYKPPSTDDVSVRSDESPNPAKPLLYLGGGFCLIQALVAAPIALFTGWHILAPAIAMLLFGAAAIWLGSRPYGRLGRLATIGWALLAIVVLLGATALQPPSRDEVAALIFLAFALTLVGAVGALAIRQRA